MFNLNTFRQIDVGGNTERAIISPDPNRRTIVTSPLFMDNETI